MGKAVIGIEYVGEPNLHGGIYRFRVNGYAEKNADDAEKTRFTVIRVEYVQGTSPLTKTEVLPPDEETYAAAFLNDHEYWFGFISTGGTVPAIEVYAVAESGDRRVESQHIWFAPSRSIVEISLEKSEFHNNVFLTAQTDVGVDDEEQPMLAATRGYVTYFVGRNHRRDNLLMNPWFTVNQRETTQQAAADTGYGADRWAKPSTNVVVRYGDDGLSISDATSTGHIRQYFDDISWLVGRPVTCSVLLGDGKIVSATAVFPAEGAALETSHSGLTFYLSGSAKFFAIRYTSGAAFTIRAAKMELGETSTLLLDSPPDYGTELLKCQRFYYRKNLRASGGLLGVATARSATSLRLPLELPVPMRATPTFATNETFRTLGAISINTLAFTLASSVDTQTMHLQATTSGLTTGECYLIFPTDNTGYLEFDAEL